MENFQAVFRCAILLALVACHEVFVGEGRQLKSTEQKFHAIKGEYRGETNKRGEESITSSDDPTTLDDEPQPRKSHTQRVDESVVRKKEIFPPIKPNSYSFRHSDVAYKDHFRPTAPGNSSGVGHSFARHDADVEANALKASPDNRYSFTRSKHNYPPTSPGHSPGVGHSFPRPEVEAETKAISKSPDVGHSRTGSEDDVRPRPSGHSPGVGHSLTNHKADAVEAKAEGKSRHVRETFTRFKVDAQPTAPGHSPGVGHVFQNKHAEPTA